MNLGSIGGEYQQDQWCTQDFPEVGLLLRNVHGSHMDWKTYKMGKYFPVREILTGKVREFYLKYWQSEGI